MQVVNGMDAVRNRLIMAQAQRKQNPGAGWMTPPNQHPKFGDIGMQHPTVPLRPDHSAMHGVGGENPNPYAGLLGMDQTDIQAHPAQFLRQLYATNNSRGGGLDTQSADHIGQLTMLAQLARMLLRKKPRADARHPGGATMMSPMDGGSFMY